MLKRLLAFVLVLVAGLLVLELAQGGKDPFRAPTSRPTAPASARATPSEASGQVRVSGGVSFENSVPVTGPDGRRFTLPRTTLRAEDSRRLDEERQELMGAHVVFHQWTFGKNGEPVISDAAQLEARRMVAGLDRRGVRLDPDRDIELSGLRLTLAGRGPLQGMVLTADHMRARPEQDIVHAWTEGELDPFQLRLRHNGAEYLLEGRGLDLRLPAADSQSPVEALIRAELHVTTLAADASARPLTASCRGATRMWTPPARQDVARLELREAVDVAVGLGQGRTLHAGCERLQLDLRRLADDQLSLEEGEMDGAPVALSYLDASLNGRHAHFVCTASGELERLLLTGEPTARVPGQRLRRAQDLELHAATSIEILDLDQAMGDLAALWIPGPQSLLPARWIRFGGPTTAHGAMELSSTGGMLAALGESDDEALFLRGLGQVVVTLPEGRASGNDGFRLRHDHDGTMRFWLGPEAESLAHEYDVKLTSGRVRGRGRFALRQAPTADGERVTLTLVEPGPGSIHAEIAAQLQAEGGGARLVTLDGARTLDLTLLRNELQTLTAHGLGLKLTDPATGIEITGRSFTTEADGVLCVVGTAGVPAELDNAGGPGRPVPTGFHIRAMEFRLRPAVGAHMALTARRDVVLRTRGGGGGGGGGGGPGTAPAAQLGDRVAIVTCDELDYLPALVSDRALELAALPGGQSLLSLWLEDLGSAGNGWVVARRNVNVEVRPARGSGDTDHLRGSLLVLSADGAHAVLVGPGASLRRDRANGTGLLCRASRITRNGDQILIGDPQGNPGALLRLVGAGDLLDGGERGGAVPTITEIVCGQPIRVTDAAIWSRGPCLVTTVAPAAGAGAPPAPDLEGDLHPPADGLRVESSGFRLLRNPAGDARAGEVREIIAQGPVTLRRGSLSAWCDAELHFDPATAWLRLSSEQDPATVEAGPALTLNGQRIEFNLRTYASKVTRFSARGAQVQR